MQDSEKKQDIHYSLSDIGKEQKACGNYNYRMRNNPLAEFLPEREFTPTIKKESKEKE